MLLSSTRNSYNGEEFCIALERDQTSERLKIPSSPHAPYTHEGCTYHQVEIIFGHIYIYLHWNLESLQSLFG